MKKSARSGRIALAISLILSATSISSFGQGGKMVLRFENMFGKDTLKFNKEYVDYSHETVKFSTLNYFISNIELTKVSGEVVKNPGLYFIVKQSDPGSKKIELDVPEGKYRSVRFMIGVDSARSTMGADKRQGALDVAGAARGMYWAWNSGYIFFKLEGRSKSVPDSLRNSFFYHIGGYGGFDEKTINNIRYKDFRFDHVVKVSDSKEAEVAIGVDIEKFYSGKTVIAVATYPSIMWGPVSVKIADNYVDIFSLRSVSVRKRKQNAVAAGF